MDISITINCPDLVTAAKAISETLCSRASKEPVASVAPAAPQPAAPVAPPVTQSAPQMTPPVAPQPVTQSAPQMTPPVAPQPVAPPVAPPPVPPQPVAPPVAPPPVPPTAPTPTLTTEQVCTAGANWMATNPNGRTQLQALCQRYGVTDPTQLKQEQLGAFATELRAMGVQI